MEQYLLKDDQVRFGMGRLCFKGVLRTGVVVSCLMILSAGSYSEEGMVSFEMSLEHLQQNGVIVSTAVGTLESTDLLVSTNLEITNMQIHGTFEDLPEVKYTFYLELLDTSNLTIAKSSASGYVRAGVSNSVTARTDIACEKVLVIIDWDSTSSTSTHDFLNFSINPDSLTLKIYKGLENVKLVAAQYAENGMRWFYPHRIWTQLDSNMVPIVKYKFGEHRNPVTTCHTALAFYDKYLDTGDTQALQGFFSNVEWLLENHNGNYYYTYDFEWEHFSAPLLKKGWVSAMAQGQALGAISIAYHLTGEQKYLEAANGVFTTLHMNGDSLWCIGIDDEDYYWLEEYPTRDFCHVLNGKLFGLFGIWNYYVITGDEFALTLFKAGLITVIDHYPSWDVRNRDLSRYCWHNTVFSNYHLVHLEQLNRYAEIFDIQEFRDAALCLSNKVITSVVDLPVAPKLLVHDNYPNPFNTSTTISFKLPHPAHVTVTVFNIRGQKVEDLLDAELSPGDHELSWDGSRYSSGVYFYTIQSSDRSAIGRMTLMK